MIAVAGWRTYLQDKTPTLPMQFWFAQMALNFMWSPVVFTLHSLASGLVIILTRLALIVGFIAVQWRENKNSGLVVPTVCGGGCVCLIAQLFVIASQLITRNSRNVGSCETFRLAEKLSALPSLRQRNLGAMLEKRWATPSKRKPKLQSNERKECDTVILRLEEREGASRERRINPAQFPRRELVAS